MATISNAELAFRQAQSNIGKADPSASQRTYNRYYTAPPPPPGDTNVPNTTSGGGGSSASTDWRDSIYNAAISRLAEELAKFEADRQLEAQNYETDFGTSLRNLGYTAGEGEFQPISLEMPTVEQATGEGAADAAATDQSVSFTPMGQFDYEGNIDPFSAAARGTSNLRNMFAARGTLRSSDYLREQQGFQKELLDQLTGMSQARGRFGQGLASRVADYRSQNEAARQQAREAAIQRALA